MALRPPRGSRENHASDLNIHVTSICAMIVLADTLLISVNLAKDQGGEVAVDHPAIERQTSRRTRKLQQTRSLLTRSALGLFAERGFDEVTVTDIANRADVDPSTFTAGGDATTSKKIHRSSERVCAGQIRGSSPLSSARQYAA